MSRISISLLLISLTLLVTLPVKASSDEQQLDNIYRIFLNPDFNLADVTPFYANNVIHVGRSQTPLLIGRDQFMATNIIPLIQMIKSGQMSFSGKVYLARRVIRGDMANDVGYLYAEVSTPDGQTHLQLQKFSWVFIKSGDTWQVITDFDSTPASLEKVTNLNEFRLIE